ncbi:F0F1 ATP synthase subunit A [Actinosynnema sp. NPDC047251]|uniref:ATP synthase subunit a n=1 Tax=Saccharothrix espanaensis (strain ATCC 51144 / DSM 44229 / JCM 9112 / NBRC 15066 / NRRL 15764) TaxID=1179773 RepID=K0JUA2_SACES|nr:F0F1 ATP synthase subunit A [Saccharothrix espanaensis]CCH31415.1 F-type H+-transporting ATPase subunit a [Saccharothrix espanaensis DSM 44229]
MADNTFTPPGARDLFPPEIVGWVTKPMILVVLSTFIIAGFFLITARRLTIVPNRLQFAAETIYDFGRNTIAREQIGGKDFAPYVPFILSLFTFVLVNNIFGIIPLIQFPTMAHIGFPAALAILLVFPTYHVVGIRRHGLRGYLRNQFSYPGVPKPVLWFLLIPTEIILKFFFDPVTLAIRVFAAMFAGHLLVVVFVLGGEFLLLHAGPLVKPVSLLSFALAIAITLLEALIQVLQAYIFATLSAHYIGRALAADH